MNVPNAIMLSICFVLLIIIFVLSDWGYDQLIGDDRCRKMYGKEYNYVLSPVSPPYCVNDKGFIRSYYK